LANRRALGASVLFWSSCLLLCGCVSGSSANASGPEALLSRLHGTRTRSGDLVIDELHGRFGKLYLGMSISATRKVMPAGNMLSSLLPGEDITYCSRPDGNDCDGAVVVRIIGACEAGIDSTSSCAQQSSAGPVVEIVLGAVADPRQTTESQEAVTLRGIRLGASGGEIARKYNVTEVGAGTCAGGAPPPGATYVAVVGENTLAITTHRDVVWTISLIEGRHPHFCSPASP